MKKASERLNKKKERKLQVLGIFETETFKEMERKEK